VDNRRSFDDEQGGPGRPAPFSRAAILPRSQARRLPVPANENRAPLVRRVLKAVAVAALLALGLLLALALMP
jgi:hypothetical protein